MIRLRRRIERGLEHPLLGPLLLLLLVVVMAFTALHAAGDQMAGGELIVCVALVLMAIVTIIVPPSRPLLLSGLEPARGPPWAPRSFSGRAPDSTYTPLRL